jgi:hypothetical protein
MIEDIFCIVRYLAVYYVIGKLKYVYSLKSGTRLCLGIEKHFP